MTESAPTTVKVGGEDRILARFRSYKVTLALDILGGVTDQVRDLLKIVADARKKYAEDNKVRISRQMCMERASELTQFAEQARTKASTSEDAEEVQELEAQAALLGSRAAMWERTLEDMGDKDFIEEPGQMGSDEEVLIALPEALKMRKQFVALIGLALIDDASLEQSWITDTVFDEIEKFGQQMLFKMEVGEEVELIAAARTMLEDQLRPRKGALDKLRSLRDLWSGTKATDEDDGEKEKPEESNGKPASEAAPSPTSSTPSPPPTDGAQPASSLPAPEPSPTT